LPFKQVINEYAQMQNSGKRLDGKKVVEAREILVNWLKEKNLMEKEQEIEHEVATAERTGATIEPLPKLQWFIDVNKKFKLPYSKLKGIKTSDEVNLKDLMKKTVESEEIKILPNRFNKTYYHWIDNLQDWCISRQIWYGHQIPIWYKHKDTSREKIYVGIETPQENGWEQDSDTLDTWFSSGLWTFSTLGWPKQTEDLKLFHPTDLLETAHDILFFWVARMILMSTYLIGEIPFKTVYIHGLIRDSKNNKFSKSLGNAIDPLDLIEKYGTDALRMSLLVAVAPGQDIKFNENKLRAYKKFANKLWNITRFILDNTKNLDKIDLENKQFKELRRSQSEIKDLYKKVTNITEDMNNYRFYLASEKIYHFVWHEFADIIIEESKKTINIPETQLFLIEMLQVILKILHPFMPFITEEIWSELPIKNKKLLIIENWPASN